MRKHILIAAVVTAAAGSTVALAAHVMPLDPAGVPTGTLVAHNRVVDIPISSLARAAAADGAEFTVQHIRLGPNQPIAWHTHPGPGIALIVRGEFTYEDAQGGTCRRTTYRAGEGFVDRGFGHVHQATAGPDGVDIYVVYMLPPGSETHLIPTQPAEACTS